MLRHVLAVAGLLTLAPSAHAVLIGVHFEGVVTQIQGDGLGYSIGDTITGTLTIDSTVAPPDTDPSPDVAAYDVYAAGGSSSFVTSSFASGLDIAADYVAYRNRSGDPAFGQDDFVIGDAEFQSAGTEYFGEGILLDVRAGDFLTGTDFLQSFDVFGGDVFHGFAFREYSNVGIYQYSNVQFDLLRLTVGPRDVTDVPEPEVLALLGAGLLLLAAFRRRRV